MKTALDTLIEELEAGTWGPARCPTRRFAQSTEPRSSPNNPPNPLPPSHKPDTTAPCGSPYCSVCYEIAPGVRIHPPKTSEEWKEQVAKTAEGAVRGLPAMREALKVKIEPMTIDYEDLAANYEPTLRSVLDYLGLSAQCPSSTS